MDDTNTFYEDKEQDQDASYEQHSQEYSQEYESTTGSREDVSYDDSYVEETIGEDEETIVEETEVTEMDSRLSTPPGSAYGSLLQSQHDNDIEPQSETEGSGSSGDESQSRSDSGTRSGSSEEYSVEEDDVDDEEGDDDYSEEQDESRDTSRLDLGNESMDRSSSHHQYDPEAPLVTNKSLLDSEAAEHVKSPSPVQKQSSLAKLSPANLLSRNTKNTGYQDLPSTPMDLEDTSLDQSKAATAYEPPPTFHSPNAAPQTAKRRALPSPSAVLAAPSQKSLSPKGSKHGQSSAAQNEGPRSAPRLDSGGEFDKSFWRDRRVILLLAFTCLLFCAGIAGLVLWLVNGRDDSGPSPASAPTRYPSRKPVNDRIPTQQPNATFPTAAPVTSGDVILDFRNSLPSYTISALDDSFSPQSLAFQWVTSESEFETLPLDRQQLRFALATLYYSTTGESWTNNAFWLSSVNECFWWTDSASSCRGSQFAFLELVNNNLNGVLPPELGLLSGLSALVIESNLGVVGSIPEALSSLSDLQELSLQSNSLVGTIPEASLVQLTMLSSMNLAQNQLSGTVPSSIAALTNLTSLYLSENRLTGSLPPSIGTLGSLRYMHLDGNRLQGPVPDIYSDLTNLAELQLQDNSLTGRLANRLLSRIGGNGLVAFNVGNNTLTGSITPAIGRLGEVQYVTLSSNGFTGSLPTELGRLTSAKLFDIGGNNALTGTLPTEVGQMLALKSLELHGTALSGSVPAEVCNLIQLNSLLVSIDCDRLSCACGCMCYVPAT